jgi:hypothetical protein
VALEMKLLEMTDTDPKEVLCSVAQPHGRSLGRCVRKD